MSFFSFMSFVTARFRAMAIVVVAATAAVASASAPSAPIAARLSTPAYSTEVVRIEGDRVIEGAPGGTQDTLTIASQRETKDGTELVLRGRGMDNNIPVEFRYTWTLGTATVRKLKEFRAPGATVWEYRHVYELATRGAP